jgi:hypothetical protein
MKKFFALLFFGLQSFHLFSQATDWSSSVASIIYSNCSSCHHEGGIAPFPLITYEDAYNNGFSIQAAVNASIMPPWPADPSYSHFRDEKILSVSEISIINDWVNAGMPAGDLLQAPAPPIYTGNSLMQVVDDTIQLPAYTLQIDEDEYRTFVVHSGYTETKYLNQVEFIPGDPSVVHHAFLFQDSSDISYNKDIATPEPGFAGGSLGAFSKYAVLLCGYIPGSDLIVLPENMGFEVPARIRFCNCNSLCTGKCRENRQHENQPEIF